jgi:transposase
MTITTIGVDLAKNVFQIHGTDAAGEVVLRKTLRRRQVLPFFSELPPCLVGMEACGTSHYWARELSGLGHEVRLMPPVYVKAYVKRGKSDAIDAEAISEALLRPNMRFAAVKSPEQQAVLMLHRSRDLLIKQRTQLVNMIRAQLAEFGIVVAKGFERALKIVAQLLAAELKQIASIAMTALLSLAELIREVHRQIIQLEKELMVCFRDCALARRLAMIPGVGFITATALVATVTDPRQFSSGREFAAWLGLTPLPNSSGGKQRLGRISKMGDRNLRRLLFIGMTSQVAAAQRKPETADPWIIAMLARKPKKLVATALANKTARIVWAMLARGENYRRREPATQIAA